MEKLSVFLSHSHKDIDKIRKIRDVLEVLDCEPLMFYLKCLDDNNETLEDFIKKEIEARNIFIYCQSENSKNSKWVQKEIDYIKSLDEKRLYSIDIDNLAFGLYTLLQDLLRLIKKNKIFIYSSKKTEEVEIIEERLSKKGYNVCVFIEDMTDIDRIPESGNSEHEISEFQKYKEAILPILEEKRLRIRENIKAMGCNGIFMPILHDETTWARRFIISNVISDIDFMIKNEPYFNKCAVSLYGNSNGQIEFDGNDIDGSMKKIDDYISNISI